MNPQNDSTVRSGPSSIDDDDKLARCFAIGRWFLWAFNVWVFVIAAVVVVIMAAPQLVLPRPLRVAAVGLGAAVHVTLIFSNFALVVFLFRVLARRLPENHPLQRIGTVLLVFVPVWGVRRYEALRAAACRPQADSRTATKYTPAKAYRLAVLPLATLLLMAGVATAISSVMMPADRMMLSLVNNDVIRRIAMIGVSVHLIALSMAFYHRHPLARPGLVAYFIVGGLFSALAGFFDVHCPVAMGIFGLVFCAAVGWGILKAVAPAFQRAPDAPTSS